ncbi:hypothetical protein HDV01_000951 [Terramyces sp. JEL0728]|nr:hypothetical protein HDV01_000951 [Terramyces sp. JEL0728]
MSSLVFQSLWKSTECINPPDKLLIFDSVNTTNVMFYLNQISTCGMFYNPDPSGSGCCTVSLDEADYGNYLGMMETFIGGLWDMDTAAPPSANEHYYCWIQNNDPTDWTYAAYLDSDQCTDKVKCFNGNLVLYSDAACTSEVQVLPIQDNIYSVNTSILGNVTVSRKQFADGMNGIAWTSYQPGNMLIPTHKNPVEVLGLIGYILSIGCSLFTSFYYIRAYYYKKSMQSLLITGIQVVEFFKVIVSLVYVYYIFQDVTPLNLVKLTLDLLTISHLFCNMLSGLLLLKILNVHQIKLNFCLQLFLVIVWVSMNILYFMCDYYWLIACEYIDYNYYNAFFNIIEVAVNLKNYYMAFVFIFDALPLIALLGIIVRQKRIKLKNRSKELTWLQIVFEYRHILGLIFFQMCVIFFYEFTAYILEYNLLMNNDRTVLGTGGTQVFWIEAHFLSVVIFNEYLKRYTRDLVNTDVDTKKKEPQKMLLDLAPITTKESSTLQGTKLEKETVVLK